MNVKWPRVVIVGGGFAGLHATHALRHAEADVTLVDRNNYHTFQPLLYQVSTAYLAPEEVGAALRAIVRRQHNVTVRMATVTGIDWSTRTVDLHDGDALPFDYLILTVGAESTFFGIDGMEEHAWPLYTLADATRLRHHLLRTLESAYAPRSETVSTVVVVGGGPTGVETAGALASMAGEVVGSAVALRVVLVESAPRLLPGGFSRRSADRALADLRGRGVEVCVGESVAAADERGVILAGGKRIDASTVVWAAGVRANALGQQVGLDTGRQQRLVVDEQLRVSGHDTVFAAGDAAAVPAGQRGSVLPMLAPAAIQTGQHAGAQVARLISGAPLTPLRYRDKGMLAVLGRGDAVAELPLLMGAYGGAQPTLRFGGRIAWLLWLGIHIVYLIGFRNRVKVLVDWGWSYLTSRGAGAILIPADESPAHRNEATAGTPRPH